MCKHKKLTIHALKQLGICGECGQQFNLEELKKLIKNHEHNNTD
jgi:hypothetical protein